MTVYRNIKDRPIPHLLSPPLDPQPPQLTMFSEELYHAPHHQGHAILHEAQLPELQQGHAEQPTAPGLHSSRSPGGPPQHGQLDHLLHVLLDLYRSLVVLEIGTQQRAAVSNGYYWHCGHCHVRHLHRGWGCPLLPWHSQLVCGRDGGTLWKGPHTHKPTHREVGRELVLGEGGGVWAVYRLLRQGFGYHAHLWLRGGVKTEASSE